MAKICGQIHVPCAKEVLVGCAYRFFQDEVQVEQFALRFKDVDLAQQLDT